MFWDFCMREQRGKVKREDNELGHPLYSLSTLLFVEPELSPEGISDGIKGDHVARKY